MMFLNQAGPGAKPGWAADIKVAPTLAYVGGGFFLNMEVLADGGLGTVENNKVTDMIQAGAGLTRLITTPWPCLPGIQITPRLAFETDRKGHHQNLLFDGDIQFFGKGWLYSVKDRDRKSTRLNS